jgi:pimeloyl-ACP methyl ester carboxylesterase
MDLKALVCCRAIYRAAMGLYAADRRAVYAHPDLEPWLDLNYPDARRLDVKAMMYYFYRMPDVDIRDMLPNITASTLALTGDRDPIVPPAQAHLIAQRVSYAELVSLEGCGHLPTAERTPQYRRVITDWIENVA